MAGDEAKKEKPVGAVTFASAYLSGTLSIALLGFRDLFGWSWLNDYFVTAFALGLFGGFFTVFAWLYDREQNARSDTGRDGT